MYYTGQFVTILRQRNVQLYVKYLMYLHMHTESFHSTRSQSPHIHLIHLLTLKKKGKLTGIFAL